MAWKREKFVVATDDGIGKSVSALTLSGIGLHRSSDKRDALGHYRWTVTHLNTGLPFLYLNVRGSSAATYFGHLVVDQADWAAMPDAADFARKHPGWISRLLGIKDRLGGRWIELPIPRMTQQGDLWDANDTAIRARRGLRCSAGAQQEASSFAP